MLGANSRHPCSVVGYLALGNYKLVHQNLSIVIYNGAPRQAFAPAVDLHHFAVDRYHLCASLWCIFGRLENLLDYGPFVNEGLVLGYQLVITRLSLLLLLLLFSLLVSHVPLTSVLSFCAVVEHTVH